MTLTASQLLCHANGDKTRIETAIKQSLDIVYKINAQIAEAYRAGNVDENWLKRAMWAKKCRQWKIKKLKESLKEEPCIKKE